MCPSRATKRTIRVRILLANAPPRDCMGYREIAGGIQRRAEVLPGETGAGGVPFFIGELRARRDAATGAAVFTGPYAFGPPTARFLYIGWSAVAPGAVGGERAMFRRLKVPLTGIDWSAVEQADAMGGVLEAVVPGTARDGGLACATVRPFAGWRVAPSDATT